MNEDLVSAAAAQRNPAMMFGLRDHLMAPGAIIQRNPRQPTRADLTREIERLRDDYQLITGDRFDWFHCPILFRDEHTELCRAHVVNQGFVGATKAWTVQRKDVDNFYGSFFESEFVLIDRLGPGAIQRTIENPGLAKKVPVKISLKGDRVDFYRYKRGPVPDEHTRIIVEGPSGIARSLVLKMSPDKVERDVSPDDWELSVEKDLRLGYNYSLSAGGHFTGWDVLGNFFVRNCTYEKRQVRLNAASHFWHFRNMVRPVVSHTPMLGGTVSDGQMYICETTQKHRWAFIVFVKLPNSLHAVVLPILDHPDGAARFYDFLSSGTSNLIVRFCKFEAGTFHAHPRTTNFEWPGINASDKLR